MSIVSDFSFRQISELPQNLSGDDPLGLLRGFVGTSPTLNPKRRWIGEGFTLIWRPNFGGAKDFFLQLMHTVEALEVSGISGTIVNRGNIQPDLFLGAISYVQSVRDRFDGSGQHFEPGIWLNVLQTKNLKEPASVVRMGSVPRGSAFQLQGQARTLANMANLIKPASIKPFKGSTAIDS